MGHPVLFVPALRRPPFLLNRSACILWPCDFAQAKRKRGANGDAAPAGDHESEQSEDEAVVQAPLD